MLDMGKEKISLVRYAGDYWVTLAGVTAVRKVDGYSSLASVKSAIRTYVVKQDSSKYIAFRGETQLKNIVQENITNPMFNPEEFEGTRTALIHWSMLDGINERFKLETEYENDFLRFMEEAEDYMEQNVKPAEEEQTADDENFISNRSAIIRQLRSDLNRLDREMETKSRNREKILQAINAMESLEIEDFQ